MDSIADGDRNVLEPIIMLGEVGGDLTIIGDRRGEDEGYPVLDKNKRDAVANSGFGPGVGYRFKAKGSAIEIRCLSGVADIELKMIES